MLAMLSVLILLALPVGGAPSAGVHDDLHRATPGPGDTVAVAPTELRLTFTGSVNARLARIELIGPAGPVALEDPAQPADSGRLVVVRIEGRLSAGEHTVRWRIIGADGHPVDGDYRFTIRDGAAGLAPPEPVPPDPAAGADEAGADAAQGPSESRRDDPEGFDSRSPLYVVVRWAGFAGLVALIGAVAFRWAVLPLVRRRAPDLALPAGLETRAAGLGLAAAGVLAAAAVGRLVAQAIVVAGPGRSPDADAVLTILTGTLWGAGWLLQAGAAVVAAAGFALARRGRPVGWAVALAAAVALGASPGLMGHAAGAGGPAAWPVVADSLHVLAAGGWMGGLLAVVVVGMPALRRSDRPRALVEIVRAFSVTALGFAAVLVLTGLAAALLHVPSWSALVESDYGRVLLLKIGLLIPLFGTGAYNFRRATPRLAGGGGPEALRRTATGELAVAVLVLLATAVLVATPPPLDPHFEASPPAASIAP